MKRMPVVIQNFRKIIEGGDVYAGRMHREIGRALQEGDLQKMLEMLRGLVSNG